MFISNEKSIFPHIFPKESKPLLQPSNSESIIKTGKKFPISAIY